MYKVLNREWERIIVESINPALHRHLSGREFTEEELRFKSVKSSPVRKEVNNNKKEIEEVVTEENTEMTREVAIEAYKEKYGRKPSHLMKTENIIAKL